MTEAETYTVFKTSMGWVGIAAHDDTVVATTLPQKTEELAIASIGAAAAHAGRDGQCVGDLAKRLSEYLEGSRVDFPDRLDSSRCTPFQRQVWEATRTIPYGETRSYLAIARQIGQPKAARAVGQALGKNPFPIIVPCHRVVGSDGGLCGFGGGLDMKRRLLVMEAHSPGTGD